MKGGIRLVDVESKIKALQISWVKNSRGGQTWQKIFNLKNKISWERVIYLNINVDDYVKGDLIDIIKDTSELDGFHVP